MALSHEDGSHAQSKVVGKSNETASMPPEPRQAQRKRTRDIFFPTRRKPKASDSEPPPPPPPHKGVLPGVLFQPSSKKLRERRTCAAAAQLADKSRGSLFHDYVASEPMQGSAQVSPMWHSAALDSRLQELKRLLVLHEIDLRSLQAENERLRERLLVVGGDAQAADQDPQQALSNVGPIASDTAEMEDCQEHAKRVVDGSLQQVCHASWLSQQEVPQSLADGPLTQSCPDVQAEKMDVERGNCVENSTLPPEVSGEPGACAENRGESGDCAENLLLQREEAKEERKTSARLRAAPSFLRPGSRSSIALASEGDKLERLVYGHRFETACGMVIVLNTVIIAMQLQYDGIQNGFELGVGEFDHDAARTWPHAHEVFSLFDIAFNACFCLELIVRTGAMKLKAVTSAWMWFDTFIVVMGLIDLFGSGGGLGFDPTMIRVVRLVRLVRLVKIFKAMSHFDSLFLLIKAIQASWIALTWSFLLLGGVQIAVGLFLCQILQGHVENEELSLDSRQKVFRYFGTFTRTMITMFEITLSNWVPSCRLLVEDVSEWFILFYIVYRCMFCFAVIKVIAAVFITETNRVLESDDELTIMKSTRNHKNYITRLYHIFKSIDVDGDGSFDWDEFQAALVDPRTSSWLATLDFELHDLEKLFWLLDNGEGKILVEDFVGKVSQLKGHAKTIDVLSMLKLAHTIDEMQRKMSQFLLVDSMSAAWDSPGRQTASCAGDSLQTQVSLDGSQTHHIEKTSKADGHTASLGGNSLQTQQAEEASNVDSHTFTIHGTSLHL